MTTEAWEKTGRDAAHEDIAGGAEPCTTLDEARRRIGQWLRSQTPAVAAADAETCAAAYLATWEAHARDTSPRAVLDLDAMERTARDGADFCDCGAIATAWCADSECGAYGCDAHQPAEYRGTHIRHEHRWAPNGTHAADVLRLVDEARRLRSLIDAAAQALDDIVAQVWRATGETHEPPADVAALTDRVDALRCEAESLTRRLAGRDETNANLLGRLIAAENAVAAARREGAEAMREACAKVADEFAELYGEAAAEKAARAIRALPPPGGEP